MPIYEYRCRECHHEFEAIQKFSDSPLTKCPSCGAEQGLAKLISAPAFRLGGSGWYETDFKKDGKRNLAHKEDGASGSANSSSQPANSEKPSKPDSSTAGSGTAASAGSSSNSSGKSASTSGGNNVSAAT